MLEELRSRDPSLNRCHRKGRPTRLRLSGGPKHRKICRVGNPMSHLQRLQRFPKKARPTIQALLQVLASCPDQAQRVAFASRIPAAFMHAWRSSLRVVASTSCCIACSVEGSAPSSTCSTARKPTFLPELKRTSERMARPSPSATTSGERSDFAIDDRRHGACQISVIRPIPRRDLST